MSMRRTRKFFICALVLLACGAAASAQEQPYTSETDEYALELPAESWKSVPRADSERGLSEFVNGVRPDGYLRLRREVVEADTKLADFARLQSDTKLRFLPGFVGGKEERFAGNLTGIAYGYEYTSAGKPMAGRIYFLKADDRNLYLLHFTGRSERLLRIRNQTDAIARSFKLKQ